MTVQEALVLTEGETVLNINKERVTVVGVRQLAERLVMVTVTDEYANGQTWGIPQSGITKLISQAG